MAHDRELPQMLGLAVDVGADIQYHGAAAGLGKTVARAGLSTPLMAPITVLATINDAPVLPAETIAWARPSLTCSPQIRMDDRFFLRKGVIGGSSMPTTSSAGTISMFGRGLPCLASCASRIDSSPTNRMEVPSSVAA